MLNLNVGPYYDNFDPSKNYHRILFKPGYAVQARELTQSQTILQNQISNFASAIYTQNTPISGGQVTTNLNCYFIKLNPTDLSGGIVKASNFNNKVIMDLATGTIMAKVLATAEAISGGDPATLIVSYLSGIQFSDGITIQPTDGTSFTATVATSSVGNPAIGLSSVASVAAGVFYVVNGYSRSDTVNPDGTQTQYSIGNFVDVLPQTVILDKYDNKPSLRVGLQINETIYDFVSDASLLDPAVGASNYQAPGADRYVITLTLSTLPVTLGNDDSFIELVRVESGNIVKQVDGTVYSTIDDYFAKRDYETNGDYIVDDFKLTPSANSNGNAAQYDLRVSKGIAYVHGYRVENQSQVILTNDRAQSTANVNTNAVFADYGNYFVVDTANGVFDIGQVPAVDFHCVPASSVVSTNTATYSSTLIGSGFMRNINYVTGTGSNTKSYVYNAYISDLATTTLSGSVGATGNTSTTFVINDTNGSFSATANAYYGVTVSISTGSIVDTRSIVNYNGGTKTVTLDNPLTVVPSSTLGSTFTMQYQQFDTESIVQTVGGGNYALIANTNISTSGKVNGQATGDTILNGAGNPELVFNIGYPYVAQLTNTNYFSQRVYHSKVFSGTGGGAGSVIVYAQNQNSANPLRFEGSGSLGGAAAEQLFMVIDNSTGSVLDFTSSGNTITISSDKTYATLSSTVYGGKNVTLIASVQVSSADSPNWVLKAKNLVNGNTAFVSTSLAAVTANTSQDLTKGQVTISRSGISSSAMSLYVNDVKNIVKIIDSRTPGTNPTGAISAYTDITNYFTLDNGQRDNFYDHAKISLLPGAPLPVGNILVVFNYYSHTATGDGYFSVQSYQNSSTFGGSSTSPENYTQIPSYTAKDGATYKLADCIDFRPCRANGQTSYVWEYSQTPTSTNDVGVLIPSNLSNFVGFYQYYLGRQDKLVLTKDKNFQIIQGTPSVTPILPAEPNGSLVIANLLHDPYTAFVPGEGIGGSKANLSVNKVLHKRWAKSDITDLETRVNNLEYYTSLNILEQSAQSMQIPDVNGLNRFKNGILVDDFSSFSTADTANPDYAANINVRQNRMTALQIVDNFQLQNPVVMSSLGTLPATSTYAISSIDGTGTNIFTLPYTTANVVVQPLASSAVSVNPFSVSVQQGIARLSPPMDNWVDNSQSPAILVTDPSIQVFQASSGVNLLNSGEFQTIPGTASYITSSTNTIGHGINPSPFGYVGYTTTTTQTYASQLQNVTAGAYNSTSTNFSTNNGYLTNVAILPYIRPQQVIVKASGLLINAPVSTYFDGQNVASYMTAPNTIELTGVVGKFNQDDVIGFFISPTFYPVARVISVYNYPNGTQSRLYVADIVGAPNAISSTSIQNGLFDVNGSYISGSATATGTISGSTNSLITLSQSGDVSGVGGSYANVLSSNTSTSIYATPVVQGWSDFLNVNGVWGDPHNGIVYNASFPVTLIAGQTYTATLAASGTAVLTANGTTITTISSNPASVSTATFVAPGNTTIIAWNATVALATTASVAVRIIDANNAQVFVSTTPPVTYTNAGTEVIMPGGGAWFIGATQLALDPVSSSNTANFYVGAKINITSKYVYSFPVSATYVPPPPAPSGGGGGGGCCVIATALTNRGDWNVDDKTRLVNWSINTLDKNFFGERLHRGYHVIASRILPFFFGGNSKSRLKYIKWSFSNATNMIQGRKFNPLSIPNSIAWMSVMLVTGLVVSKDYSESSWKNLYKDKK